MERYKCIKNYPEGPDVGEHAIQIDERFRHFRLFEDDDFSLNHDPADFPECWERVDRKDCSLINGEYFNLRDNADIVSLAQKAATSLDSTDLKLYFKKKLNL